MAVQRRPPAPYPRAPRGTCKFCGDVILKPNGERDPRRSWHRGDRGDRNCLGEYMARDPGLQRRRIWKRDGGVCAECGRLCAGLGELTIEDYERAIYRVKGLQRQPRDGTRHGWHADHRIPLEDGGRHTDDNVQTLCIPCHRTKTAQENKRRRRRTTTRSKA